MSSHAFTRLPVAFAIAPAGTIPAFALHAQQTAGSVCARAEAEDHARRSRAEQDMYGVIDGLVTDSLLNPMNVADFTVAPAFA